MFRIISITGFAVVFTGIALHCATSAAKKGQLRPGGISAKVVHLLTLLFFEQKLNAVGVLRRLIYLLALLCFIILVITGFYRPLVLGESIGGYWLMVHATAAPVFAACLAVLAVMWAHNCRFEKGDWPWLQRLVQQQAPDKTVDQSYGLVRRICFWLIILMALPVILSIVLSMFRFFGTAGQEFLINLHRYSALVLAVVIIVHTYLVIRTRMEQ